MDNLTDNQKAILTLAVQNQGIWHALAQRRCAMHYYPSVLSDLTKKGMLMKRGQHYYPTHEAVQWYRR